MKYSNNTAIIVSFLALVFVGCTTNPVKTAESPSANTPSPSPTPVRESRPFDPQSDIGSINYGSGCSRLRILNDSLLPGDSVRIVGLEHPQQITSATIIEPTGCTESVKSTMGHFVIDSEIDKEPSKYQIEFDNKKTEEEFDFHLGIAIVNSENKLLVNNGTAELEMAGGSPLRFRECTSFEGMHLTVWEGKPLTGKRIWHGYQHFLYGTDPTCKDKEASDLYVENDDS